MVHEDESVTLQDFGAAGVVIDSPTGGAYCPSTFRLIHPDTGALRVVSPGNDRDTVFGECQRLGAVLPDLVMIVMAQDNANEQARVYTWNGFRITETIVKRSPAGVRLPSGGADVERWMGGYLFELASDA